MIKAVLTQDFLGKRQENQFQVNKMANLKAQRHRNGERGQKKFQGDTQSVCKQSWQGWFGAEVKLKDVKQ